MDETDRRRALIIASDAYVDTRLRQLRSPADDAQKLARVLADPSIGDFSVTVLNNEREYVLRRAVGAFFNKADRDDVLLLHLACHGVKDEDGTLYFAATDTETDNLSATAIQADFVNTQMNRSRSRRIVLFLDCCYSGAFARGMSHRGTETLQLNERFEGRGRVVLTASNSMEYAWEGNDLIEMGEGSIFTRAVVDGLEAGDADLDGDGQVSVDELYDYVFDRVRRETPNQTPGKWSFDVAGDLVVAQSTRGVQPAVLPDYIQELIANPLSEARLTAVSFLQEQLLGPHRGLALAARTALESLTQDDSRAVSSAAAGALEGAAGAEVEEPEIEQQEPEIEQQEPEIEQQEPEIEQQEPETREHWYRKWGAWWRSKRRLALVVGAAIAVPIAIGLALLARDDSITDDPQTQTSTPPTDVDQLLTQLPPTASSPLWQEGAKLKGEGCTFTVKAGVLTVSQEADPDFFCKTGTVDPNFRNLLEPPTRDLLGDIRVITDATLVEGTGRIGLRCRGTGSTAAWSGYMVSIDSAGMWLLERYEQGHVVDPAEPEELPAGVVPGPKHRLELLCVGGGDTFTIEFAVDGIAVPIPGDLEVPSSAGQVGIAIDSGNPARMTVEFRNFTIFVPG